MVERMAKEADEELYCYILKGVTEGVSYDYMRVKFSIPCCKGYLLQLVQTVLLAAQPRKRGDRVKIVDVAVKKVYRFNCPN